VRRPRGRRTTSRERTFIVLRNLLILLLVCACTTRRADVHVSAASLLTQRYAASRFAAWHVRASAAGADCAVLVVQTSVLLEDRMVEAMHYGAGTYEVFGGGVDGFARMRGFRGVAYRDVAGRVWTYGAVRRGEAERACK
jgi:hypothetical protein